MHLIAFIVIGILLLSDTLPALPRGVVDVIAPAPVIHNLNPTSTTASAKAFTMAISGANFVKDLKVFLGASEITKAELYGDSLIVVEVPAPLNYPASSFFTVTNPDFVSASYPFVIAPKPYLEPVITHISPASNTQREWASFELTILGSSFDTNTVEVLLRAKSGEFTLQIKTREPNKIIAIVPSSIISGQYDLIVRNPDGGDTETFNYGILQCDGSRNYQPADFRKEPAINIPIIKQVTPASHTQYEKTSFTLTITGRAFWCLRDVELSGEGLMPIPLPIKRWSGDSIIITFPSTLSKGNYQIRIVHHFWGYAMPTTIPYTLLQAPVSIGQKKNTSVHWYPQPAHDAIWFEITVQNSSFVTIEIWSVIGQKLHSITKNVTNNRILEYVNLSATPSGTYFLVINDGTTRSTYPVILSK